MTGAGRAGRAVLVAWTDIASEEEAEFNDWYNREHVRDRVLGIPGFLRGRRFVALRGGPKYLATYDTTGPDVLNSDAYIGLVSRPDPRSEHFILRFRNAIRTLGRLSASAGEAEGAFLAVLPLAPAPAAADRDRLRGALESRILPELLRRRGVVAVDLIERDEATRTASTRRHVRQGDRSLDWALFIEGADLHDLSEAVDALTAEGELPSDPAFEPALLQLVYRVDSYGVRPPT